MKVLTERIAALQTHNNQGHLIVVKGQTKVIIHTVAGKQVWATPDQIASGANSVQFMVHEKGDTFVATKDSNRFYPKGDANEGNPLYSKGDTVTRTSESLEMLSTSAEEVFTEAAKQKMEFAAKLGLAVKI